MAEKLDTKTLTPAQFKSEVHERESEWIIEMCVGFRYAKLTEDEKISISNDILEVLRGYGIDTSTYNDYVEFRNQWDCDMNYDGG